MISGARDGERGTEVGVIMLLDMGGLGRMRKVLGRVDGIRRQGKDAASLEIEGDTCNTR